MGNYETQEPADRLRFSLDQGRCWHSVLFSEAIDIRNIRCFPEPFFPRSCLIASLPSQPASVLQHLLWICNRKACQNHFFRWILQGGATRLQSHFLGAWPGLPPAG